MAKFRQISQELLHLIYVKIGFSALSWTFFWPIFFKLCIRVDFLQEWFGIIDG